VRGGESTEGESKNIFSLYLALLDKFPIRTKSITSGVVTALGDMLSQYIEHSVLIKTTGGFKLFSMNWPRLWSFTVVGTFFVGPFVHYIYELLWAIGRFLESNYKFNKNASKLIQVLFDQTVGVALFFPTYFYIFEGVEAIVCKRIPSWHGVTEKLREELYGVILMNYRLWPLVNYLNFTFTPENLRVFVSNLVSVFWNAYLCTRVA